MGDQLGYLECVAMALGGMVGGSIYAVLGVAAQVTGPATWIAFVLAGVVAACAGYAYLGLNAAGDRRGGPVSFLQQFVGNPALVGVVGWTLLFGYVGSMAMFAFAFAEFATLFLFVPERVRGLPIRPLVSVLAVALFVALNLLGARITGTAETVFVAVTVAVLVAFGGLGVVYTVSVSTTPVSYGVDQFASASPVVAAAISFVAFQEWQLLFYDQESIAGGTATLRRAIFTAIPVAVVVYVLVAVVTANLAPSAVRHSPHIALAAAASTVLSEFGARGVGYVVISLAAMFSTGGAINATMFSSAHFAKRLVRGDLLPDRFGDEEAEGVPKRTVLALGAVTALVTAYGSLDGITSFASLAFITVFGVTCLLALLVRDRAGIHPLPPAVGVLGAFGFAILMVLNLYEREPATLRAVVVLGVVLVAVELLYFEREAVSEQVAELEDELNSRR